MNESNLRSEKKNINSNGLIIPEVFHLIISIQIQYK